MKRKRRVGDEGRGERNGGMEELITILKRRVGKEVPSKPSPILVIVIVKIALIFEAAEPL